jgi:hypothetical protein
VLTDTQIERPPGDIPGRFLACSIPNIDAAVRHGLLGEARRTAAGSNRGISEREAAGQARVHLRGLTGE